MRVLPARQYKHHLQLRTALYVCMLLRSIQTDVLYRRTAMYATMHYEVVHGVAVAVAAVW